MKLRSLITTGLFILSIGTLSAMAAAKDYTLNFESRDGIDASSSGKITKAEGEVITGTGSFLIDSTKSNNEWNERLATSIKTIQLEPGADYTLDFDYRILTPESDDGYFYAMFRVKSTGWGHDQGYIQWTSADGMEGHLSTSFTLEDFPDYILLCGARFKGKVVIDNIEIKQN